jgi:hypothetical protein
LNLQKLRLRDEVTCPQKTVSGTRTQASSFPAQNSTLSSFQTSEPTWRGQKLPPISCGAEGGSRAEVQSVKQTTRHHVEAISFETSVRDRLHDSHLLSQENTGCHYIYWSCIKDKICSPNQFFLSRPSLGRLPLSRRVKELDKKPRPMSQFNCHLTSDRHIPFDSSFDPYYHSLKYQFTMRKLRQEV